MKEFVGDRVDKLLPVKLREAKITSVSASNHFGFHDETSPACNRDLQKIIDLILKSNLELRFMTTISRSNYLHIREMVKQTKTVGAKGIKFTNLLKTGNAVDLSDWVLSDEQIKFVLSEINEMRKVNNREKLVIERSGTFGSISGFNRHFECVAGTNTVAVAPNKKVYPCVFLTQSGYEIGEFNGEKSWWIVRGVTKEKLVWQKKYLMHQIATTEMTQSTRRFCSRKAKKMLILNRGMLWIV
jgi:radical SAM protein with 4Fe4S-binding SPASM domain